MQNSTIVRKDNEMEEIKSISKLNENDDDLKIIREFVTSQTKGENNEEK